MKKYFALATVATMFVTCSNEVIEPQVDALTGMLIQVKTNVVNLVERRAVTGRDSENDFSEYSLRIAGDTEYYAVMKKNNGEWKSYASPSASSPMEMTWTNGNPVTVTAVLASQTSSVTESVFMNGSNFMVSKDQTADEYAYKKSDMLYMEPTEVTPDGDGSITVNFSHLLSKVRISIHGVTGDTNPVSNVKVNGTKYQFSFVPSTGEWKQNEYLNDVAEITAKHDSYADGTSVYEVILVPQEVVENVFSVSFVMDGKTYQWTSSSKVNLESGKLYTLVLQIPDNDPTGKAVAVSIDVKDWPTETVTLGDDSNDVTVVE